MSQYDGHFLRPISNVKNNRGICTISSGVLVGNLEISSDQRFDPREDCTLEEQRTVISFLVKSSEIFSRMLAQYGRRYLVFTNGLIGLKVSDDETRTGR